MTATAFADARAELAELERAEEMTPDMTLPPMAQLPAVLSVESQFLPVPMDLIREVATLLHGMPGLPALFQDLKACEAIAYRAARWRVDPVFVAEQSYQAKPNGPIGYQAKLLKAVLLANAPFERRPRYIYGYGGDGAQTVANRFCKVFFFLKGEAEPFSITTPTVAQIKVKNSPEWFSHTDKQLAYYAIRAGGNIHFPDVLAGVFTVEEVKIIAAQDREPRGHALFEEDEPPVEPIDAEFDSIPQTVDDLKRHQRQEQKAEGGDSRDPRDAPSNRQEPKSPPAKPEPPPQGSVEPDDLAELRAWAASEQTRIMAIPIPKAEVEAWNELIREKRWNRLKAYAQDVTTAIKAAIMADIETKKAGA